MSRPFDAFQHLAPPLREEDKPLLLARLLAEFDDETDEIAAAAWAMGARAFCNSALGRTICRVCGCWELEACAGGCTWVEPGLCSKCAPAPRLGAGQTAALRYALDERRPPTVESCIACDAAFVEGDRYLLDQSGGSIHLGCCGPDRESYVNAAGGPLGPDDAIPEPLVWAPANG